MIESRKYFEKFSAVSTELTRIILPIKHGHYLILLQSITRPHLILFKTIFLEFMMNFRLKLAGVVEVVVIYLLLLSAVKQLRCYLENCWLLCTQVLRLETLCEHVIFYDLLTFILLFGVGENYGLWR